jgi:hypothetical protein
MPREQALDERGDGLEARLTITTGSEAHEEGKLQGKGGCARIVI